MDNCGSSWIVKHYGTTWKWQRHLEGVDGGGERGAWARDLGGHPRPVPCGGLRGGMKAGNGTWGASPIGMHKRFYNFYS